VVGTRSRSHANTIKGPVPVSGSTAPNGNHVKFQGSTTPAVSNVDHCSSRSVPNVTKTPVPSPSSPFLGSEALLDNYSHPTPNGNHEEHVTLVTSERRHAATFVLALLKVFATAYRALCFYRCEEAISSFQRLPVNHYNTGWVLSHVGRAYFEKVNYHDAKLVFEQHRKVQSYRTEGMEIYSTLLWHMKQTLELSYLAHQLIEVDDRVPQSWCALGNCFSLQKEHESAIKFFQRALQLDANFAYAHTLCGHEYAASDQLDKAIASFRNALRIDDRHYNAWYGLGMIYYRQEKYDLAEYHFRKALEINSGSSVLHCYHGMVLYSSRKPLEALDVLDHTIRIDPKNTIAKFKRASVLATLNRPHEALEELKLLKESAPKEAPIYFLMGKVLKKMGKPEEAVLQFTTALDLDAKNANYIKNIIDKLHLPDIADLDEQADLG